MKYTVTAAISEDKEISTVVSCRFDAKNKTKFDKCMNAIGCELIKRNVISPKTTYSYALPNVWTNGYLGAAWFIDPFINVTIQEENGAWLAM